MLLAGSGCQQEKGRPGPGARLVVVGTAGEGWVWSGWIPGSGSEPGFQRLRGSGGVPADRCTRAGSVSTEKG